jgi:spore maturation protein SpmB
MSAMILNISSNMLGLANAATPFGIKAMEELDRLNSRKGTATDAMVLFLAINTAGLALLPTGVVGLRASLGSQDAMAILLPTWIASGCATLVGVGTVLVLSRLPRVRSSAPAILAPASPEAPPLDAAAETQGSASRGRTLLALAIAGTFVVLALRYAASALETEPATDVIKRMMSSWVLGALVGGILLHGFARGVKVYDSLVEGAKEGFQVALRIIPYLVAILVMIAMLRAAGGIDLFVAALSPWTERIGMPAEALPMALLRPLSGSGAYGVMASIMETHGPDSLIGTMVSTFQGSTETTFYVLAVYCGAVGVTRTRHALPACLAADVAGLLTATWVVRLLHG